MDKKEIIEYLKNTLPKLTPELAKEKFNIEWIGNSLDEHHDSLLLDIKPPSSYPPVVICHIHSEVGHGLFTLDRIEKGNVVVEYTGKRGSNYSDAKKSDYVLYSQGAQTTDAEHEGNAARFAQHMPMVSLPSDIIQFTDTDYEFFTDDVATGNIHANTFSNELNTNDSRIAMVSIKDINEFEQLGFSYGTGYWATRMTDPHLFNKNGSVLPKDSYKGLNSHIFLTDQKPIEGLTETKEHIESLYNAFINKNNEDEYAIIDLAKLNNVTIFNYKKEESHDMNQDNPLKFIVKKEMWNDRTTRVRDFPPLVAGYFVNSYTDIDKFISLLKKLDHLKISQEEQDKILDATKENRHDEVKQLLLNMAQEKNTTEELKSYDPTKKEEL